MLPLRPKAFIIALASCFAVPLSAGIITSSGVTVLSSPPASVQFNQLQSNTTVYAFQEQSGATLAAPLVVDATAPGTYASLLDIPLPSAIPSGTKVNSYYLSADPDLTFVSLGYVLYPGRSVTFSPGETVIGIQFVETSLLLGALTLSNGTLYPPPPVGYGLELTNAVVLAGKDMFTLSPDRRTFSFDLITGSGSDTGGVDQIRLITSVAPVPEPGTIFLMLAGASCLIAVKRRSRG